MAILNQIGYSYNDLTIVPAYTTRVKSRSEVNPFYNSNNEHKHMPIFAAPMSTIINEKNFYLFEKNGIIPILPRNIDINIRLDFLKNDKWIALSLKEFDKYIINEIDAEDENIKHINILIDIANGHMGMLADLVKRAKSIWGDKLTLMCGNIANPTTYTLVCEAGVDYIRCSIGSGSCCTTTSNVAIHYPIGSLLDEINKIKTDRQKSGLFCTKVIADGGIRNYSDVIKALALGADYVMIGGLFGTFIEACGKIIGGDNFINEDTLKYENDYQLIKESLNKLNINNLNNIIILIGNYVPNNFTLKNNGLEVLKIPTTNNLSTVQFNYYTIIDIYSDKLNEKYKRALIDRDFTRESFGMSTKKAQSLIKDNVRLKTAEGIEKQIHVKYTMSQWIENMEAYLRSVMSYCNSFTLDEFIGKQSLIINTAATINSVNK